MCKDKNKSTLEWLSGAWGRIWAIVAAGLSLATLFVSIFHWEADKTIAVICFGCVILIISGVMIDHRGDENRAKINEIAKTVDNIREDTLRIQLSMAIQSRPENTETILKIARVYFVDLGGDWVATNEFLHWADENNVYVPSDITKAIELNEHK